MVAFHDSTVDKKYSYSMFIYSLFVLYFSNMVNVKFYIFILDDYNIARAAMFKAKLSSCLESDDNLVGKRKSK